MGWAMSGQGASKKKRLVLDAKFATQLKTELAPEAAGLDRSAPPPPPAAVAVAPVAAVFPAPVKRSDQSSRPAPSKTEAKKPNAKERAPPPLPPVPEVEADDWMNVEELPQMSQDLPHNEGGKEKSCSQPLLNVGQCCVLQMGRDGLEGPAKLVRYKSGAMAIVSGGKKWLLCDAASGIQVVTRVHGDDKSATVLENDAPLKGLVLARES